MTFGGTGAAALGKHHEYMYVHNRLFGNNNVRFRAIISTALYFGVLKTLDTILVIVKD